MTNWTKKQQKEHRKELVKALRSGKYQQGFGRLRRNNNYCCLGVACDISGQNSWVSMNEEGNNNLYYHERLGAMPDNVMNYYGFKNMNGMFRHFRDIKFIFDKHEIYCSNEIEIVTLSYLNDALRIPFNVIADIIELEPEGMIE